MPGWLINAVLVAMIGTHNDAFFARYAGIVPWGVLGGAAQRAGRWNAQRACCDAQSEWRQYHGGIICNR
jgi:hypothetical protein